MAGLWNLVGISDSIVAVGTGFLSAPGRFRLAVSAPSTEVLTLLPLVIVPVFLVPLSILLHAVSLQKLRAEIRPQVALRSLEGQKMEAH